MVQPHSPMLPPHVTAKHQVVKIQGYEPGEGTHGHGGMLNGAYTSNSQWPRARNFSQLRAIVQRVLRAQRVWVRKSPSGIRG